MALTNFNSIGGYSVGVDANTVIDANGNITANTLEVTAAANLGAVGNITITGGTGGQFLQTDGSGALSWANAGGGGGGNVTSQPAIQFTASGNSNNQTFSNANLVSFMSNAYGMVFKNGVLVDVADYVISGTTLTLNVYAQDGDSVTVAPVTGPTPAPAGVNTQLQFNDGGAFGASAGLKFTKSSNTLAVGGPLRLSDSAGKYVELRANGVSSNTTYTLPVTDGNSGQVLTTAGNGILSWANAGAGGANTQVQFNDGGNLGASANFTFNKSTNTLSATNISGNGSGLTAVAGANVTGTVANANYSAYAGLVVTAAQPNITSLGNLTSLAVTGTSNLGNVGNVRIIGGSNGQVLTTNGSGNLSWTTISGGGSGSSIANGNANLAIYDSNLQLKLGNISNVLYAEAYQLGANWYTSTVTANANIAITSTTTGPNSYGGFLTVDKGITAQYITSNTSISAATIQGVIAASSNTQPNITSVGTLTALGVTGNLTVSTGNISTSSGNITSGNNVSAKNFYGYGADSIDFKVGNSGMTVSNASNASIATVALQAVDGANGGNAIIISKTAMTTALNVALSGSNISLGNVSSVKITGGITGQVLTTDGNGNLSFGNSISSLSNGTSNITIVSNGNITMSSANTANVINISNTAVNVNAALTVSGAAASFNNGLQGILFSGNSNIRIWSPDGIVALSATGTANVLRANVSTVSVLNFESQGLSNLNSVGNITITGGTNGQVLTTNGSGGLSWTTVSGGSSNSITSGNSNVSVAANGNVTVSSAGNANIVTVTGTGANVAGTLNVTGNSVFTGANIHLGGNGNVKITGGTSGQVLSTDGAGNLSWTTAGGGSGNSISSGNSNVAFAAANGNINLTSAGNITLVVTGTGANITGTTNVTGNLTAGNLIGHLANGNSSVKINTANGNVTISAAGNANIVTVTGTGANVAGTLNATGNVALSGANVSLGNIENLKITGGNSLQIMTTDGTGNLSWTSGTGSSSQFLFARRSTNQTIPSGTWGNVDVVMNQVDASSGITYNSTTGTMTLTGGVTYRVTAQLSWNSGAAYAFAFRLVNSDTGVQVAQAAETLSSSNPSNNPPAPVLDIVFTPATTGNYRLRIGQSVTAQSGESIRFDLGTFLTVVALANTPLITQGGWTVDTAWTLGGTTTAPTMATTNNRRLAWKVDGKMMYINAFYRQTSSTGAAAGSGEYFLTLPGGYQIDTTVTGTAAVGTAFGLPVGSFNYTRATFGSLAGTVIAHDSTKVKFIFGNQQGNVTAGTPSAWSATYGNLNAAAAVDASFQIQVPIL